MDRLEPEGRGSPVFSLIFTQTLSRPVFSLQN